MRRLFFFFTENKVEDVTLGIVDGATQLIELTLQVQDGIQPTPQPISMTVDPVKLQTLLYGITSRNRY